jgi:hypothetical protein
MRDMLEQPELKRWDEFINEITSHGYWTQKEIAELLRTTRETVHQWLGKRLLSVVGGHKQRRIIFTPSSVGLLFRYDLLRQANRSKESQRWLMAIRQKQPWLFQFPSWVKATGERQHPVTSALMKRLSPDWDLRSLLWSYGMIELNILRPLANNPEGKKVHTDPNLDPNLLKRVMWAYGKCKSPVKKAGEVGSDLILVITKQNITAGQEKCIYQEIKRVRLEYETIRPGEVVYDQDKKPHLQANERILIIVRGSQFNIERLQLDLLPEVEKVYPSEAAHTAPRRDRPS